MHITVNDMILPPLLYKYSEVLPTVRTNGNLSSKITFIYTYYTMAHKCNKQQLLAIPASYENKHRPSESGRPLCDCLNASSVEESEQTEHTKVGRKGGHLRELQ